MSASKDAEFETCLNALGRVADFHKRAGICFQNAIDHALNGAITGRYSINQLNKTEKTLVGVLLEREFRSRFGLCDGKVSDVSIEGVDVGIKFSLRESGWMFGPENTGELCIIGYASEDQNLFRLGMIRPCESDFRPGKNRDSKAGLSSAASKDRIIWLIANGTLPINVLHHMAESTRNAIFSERSGTARIRQLFRLAQSVILDATRIRTAGWGLEDPIRRVRTARSDLMASRLIVLGWDRGRLEAASLGYHIGNSEYVCVPEEEFREKKVLLPEWYKPVK